MRYETLYPLRFDPRAGDDPGPADPPAADPPAPAAAADSGQTLLGNGADGQTQPFQVPEKFMVAGQDGQPDYRAIVEKLGQSYAHLEKRLGTGDLPPKSADEYQLERYLPEGMEPNQEAVKSSLAEFHKLGLTQKQVQGVMAVFGQQVDAGLARKKEGFESGQAALKSAWGEQYDRHLADARKAFEAYATEDPELKQLAADPELSNNPLVLRLLALAGAELGEDRPPRAMEGAAAERIDEIMRSKAYFDPKDPGHAAAVRTVSEAYAKGYRANRQQ